MHQFNITKFPMTSELLEREKAPKIADILQNLLADLQVEAEVDLRTDYSGRFMYGSTCLGLVGMPADLENVINSFLMFITLDLADSDPDWLQNLITMINSRCIDDMGKGKIYYWPMFSNESTY